MGGNTYNDPYLFGAIYFATYGFGFSRYLGSHSGIALHEASMASHSISQN